MASLEVPHYIPQFLWKFWLSGFGQPLFQPRLHIYDVYDNTLSEMIITQTPPIAKRTGMVFRDFEYGLMDEECRSSLQAVEEAFSCLESQAEIALANMMCRINPATGNDAKRRRVPMECQAVDALRKFFTFLRYRNSDRYVATVLSLRDEHACKHGTAQYDVYHRVRKRFLLHSYLKFLLPSPVEDVTAHLRSPEERFDSCQELKTYCWRLRHAELCIGVASEDQEFMLTDACFGTLDEGFNEDPECGDLFFPVSPTVALYILANTKDEFAMWDHHLRDGLETVWMDCGVESPSDVHLRNAMLLQTYPRHLYFSSLRSVAQSISSYDEFRWIPEHQDYSRLKQRCRQKYTQEDVTKTLVIKGSVMLTDLTDEVVRVGTSAVAHGSFSDVWKGTWTNSAESKPKMVALKFLRQVMVQNVREKSLKRLKDEVLAWHRLQHRNIAHLYGVVQSSSTIAMVSPWCENGTIGHYLKEINPSADRLKLGYFFDVTKLISKLVQVASGVSYLHNFKPVIVHGDLKGGNILVDDHGQSIITDFGLSKVLEEISDTVNIATSFFAGSTRWMAPELVLALVEDNGHLPPITTCSDVYAFASVCLEVVTGRIPYAHRTNDHAVTVDIMRGVKPSRGAASCVYHHHQGGYHESFWAMLDRCWDAAFSLRPSISDVLALLESIV